MSESAELRTNDSVLAISAGATFVFAPGEPHQLKNVGSEELLYYVIADNPVADVITYPDSQKCVLKPLRKCFALQESDYYANEE